MSLRSELFLSFLSTDDGARDAVETREGIVSTTIRPRNGGPHAHLATAFDDVDLTPSGEKMYHRKPHPALDQGYIVGFQCRPRGNGRMPDHDSNDPAANPAPIPLGTLIVNYLLPQLRS